MAGLNLKSLQNLSQIKKPDLSIFTEEENTDKNSDNGIVSEEQISALSTEINLPISHKPNGLKIKKISLNELKTGVVSVDKKEKISTELVENKNTNTVPKMKLSISKGVVEPIKQPIKDIVEEKSIQVEESISLTIEPTPKKMEEENIVVLMTEQNKNIQEKKDNEKNSDIKTINIEDKPKIEGNREIFPNYDFTKELNLGAEFMISEQNRPDGVSIEKNKECTEIAVGINKPAPSFFWKITQKSNVDDVLSDLLDEVKDEAILKKDDTIKEEVLEKQNKEEKNKNPIVIQEKKIEEIKQKKEGIFIWKYQKLWTEKNTQFTSFIKGKRDKIQLFRWKKEIKIEDKIIKESNQSILVDKKRQKISQKMVYTFVGILWFCSILGVGTIFFGENNDKILKSNIQEISLKNVEEIKNKKNSSYKEGVDYFITKNKKKNKSRKNGELK